MFDRRVAGALARLAGEPLRITSEEVAEALNLLALRLVGHSSFHQSSPDSEYAAYVRSIATHAAALHQLLYGAVPDANGPFPFIATGALDALFYMGTPNALQDIRLEMVGLGEDLPLIADNTGKALWVLHKAATYAEAQWAPVTPKPSRANRARPHIGNLVSDLAVLYGQAFGKTVPRRPHEDSPVSRFCLLMCKAIYRRLQRAGYGLSSTDATADGNTLQELKFITGPKVSEYLRRRQGTGVLAPPAPAS